MILLPINSPLLTYQTVTKSATVRFVLIYTLLNTYLFVFKDARACTCNNEYNIRKRCKKIFLQPDSRCLSLQKKENADLSQPVAATLFDDAIQRFVHFSWYPVKVSESVSNFL
jgi:hypothetical protein